MKERHSVLSGEDIVAGTKGRLRGTHVYPIDINRKVKPPSAKILTGISQYGDFEYTSAGIITRENTRITQGKLFDNQSVKKLVKNCLSTTEASCGFDINIAKVVPPLTPKIYKLKPKASEIQTNDTSTNKNQHSLSQSKRCGKKFLRTGNLERHRQSKICTSTKLGKEKSQNPQSMPHKLDSLAMKTALSKIKWQSVKQQPKQISEQKQVNLALELKGSAQRRAANKRKAIRFTEEQRQIMDRCFDSAVKRKSARYTLAQCQKEMERQIGPDYALKESQIRAYFSRHHAKLSKEE